MTDVSDIRYHPEPIYRCNMNTALLRGVIK